MEMFPLEPLQLRSMMDIGTTMNMHFHPAEASGWRNHIRQHRRDRNWELLWHDRVFDAFRYATVEHALSLKPCWPGPKGFLAVIAFFYALSCWFSFRYYKNLDDFPTGWRSNGWGLGFSCRGSHWQENGLWMIRPLHHVGRNTVGLVLFAGHGPFARPAENIRIGFNLLVFALHFFSFRFWPWSPV